MLALNAASGQNLLLGETKVTVLEIGQRSVRLGIHAPAGLPVHSPTPKAPLLPADAPKKGRRKARRLRNKAPKGQKPRASPARRILHKVMVSVAVAALLWLLRQIMKLFQLL